MRNKPIHYYLSSIILVALVASQILFASVFLIPQTAQAQAGAFSLLYSVPTADQPTIFERIVIAIARQIALRFSQAFINKFVNQLVAKYKIQNYLYYDQILTNYYLSNLIRDKIADPDLQQIFQLMDAAYISGQNTGLSGQPNPANALIPKLKSDILQYYKNQGGIDPSILSNPPANMSNADYFAAYSAYYWYPPSYVEQNLQGQFGSFQSAATTAAQLEVAVGQGFKNGRVIGGYCKMPPTFTGPPANDPATCQKEGGTWQASALDQARSFISNPTAFIQSNLDSFIKTQTNYSFNPNDFWTMIGTLVGNFIYNKLALDSSGGTLNDNPAVYQGSPYDVTAPKQPNQIDIDGDKIPDGTDLDGDGKIDICTYGGNPPDACVGSKTAINPPPPTDGGQGGQPPADALTKHPDQTAAVVAAKASLAAAGETFLGSCGSFKITNLAAWNIGGGAGVLLKPSGHRCEVNGTGYAVDVVIYQDGYNYDVLIGSSDPGTIGQNGPAWQPGAIIDPARYAPPIDPATLSSANLVDF